MHRQNEKYRSIAILFIYVYFNLSEYTCLLQYWMCFVYTRLGNKYTSKRTIENGKSPFKKRPFRIR